ncbi:hypothetical protein ACHHYP_20648 [Achlya hypogyna]|uniref:Uncharacterized protein n=1 Tax=Achlya hypogyna TaxID=1202772 RepID=A0A1V9YG54_ACHHY|nr:hypothetical protein ACHHYP_20648 [Achlya hypogyna]
MPTMYQGPRLAELSQFGTWKRTFLAAAANDIGTTAYYTVPDFVDRHLVDTIGPARLRVLETTADVAVPEVPENLTPAQLEGARIMRQRQVDAIVKDAIAAECADLNALKARAAADYLSAAVDPSVGSVLAGLEGPFALWQRLATTSSHGVADLVAAYSKAVTKTFQAKRPTYQPPGEFFSEFDTVADAFIDAVLASEEAEVLKGKKATAVAAYRREVAAKLKIAMLGHATGPHAPDVLCAHVGWDVPRFQIHLLPSMTKASTWSSFAYAPSSCAYCGFSHGTEPCRQLALDWENRNQRPGPRAWCRSTAYFSEHKLVYVPRTEADMDELVAKHLIKRTRKRKTPSIASMEAVHPLPTPSEPTEVQLTAPRDEVSALAHKRQMLEERCVRRTRSTTF